MVEGQGKATSCISPGMFGSKKNAKTKKISRKDFTRGIGSDPTKLMDDFCEEDRFEGFIEDYNELSEEQKAEFKEEMNKIVDDINLGDILDRCDYEESREAITDLRLEQKKSILEKLVSYEAIQFANE